MVSHLTFYWSESEYTYTNEKCGHAQCIHVDGIVGDVMALWAKVCVQFHSRQVIFSRWLEKPDCFFMCILSWVLEYFLSKLLVEVYNECVYDLPARDMRNAEREGGGCAGECHTMFLHIYVVYCSDLLREVKAI